MTNTAPYSAMPIPEGLAALLREKTGTIDSQCARFLIEKDAEALHDLRVAMRRLHSLFAAFSPCFRRTNPLKKRLRAMLKATNAARDIEVTLALVEKLELELPDLQQLWQKQLEEEYRQLQTSIPPALQTLSSELTSPQGMLAENLATSPLGAYTATLAAAEARKFNHRMKALADNWGKQRAHKLRIQGKRIRYLLEPFVEESESVTVAVSQLKQVQDLLGDYHDIVVLRQKLNALPSPDPLTQKKRLTHSRDSLKKALRQLRKTFLREYRSKERKRLQKIILQAAESLDHSL